MLAKFEFRAYIGIIDNILHCYIFNDCVILAWYQIPSEVNVKMMRSSFFWKSKTLFERHVFFALFILAIFCHFYTTIITTTNLVQAKAFQSFCLIVFAALPCPALPGPLLNRLCAQRKTIQIIGFFGICCCRDLWLTKSQQPSVCSRMRDWNFTRANPCCVKLSQDGILRSWSLTL